MSLQGEDYICFTLYSAQCVQCTCLLILLHKGIGGWHRTRFYVSWLTTLYLTQYLVHYRYLKNVHWKKLLKPDIPTAMAYKLIPILTKPCYF